MKELCRKHGFSEQSYDARKAKFGGMANASDAQGLKELEAESTKLKKLLAHSTLEIDAMREVPKGKQWPWAARRVVKRDLSGAAPTEGKLRRHT